MNREQLLDLLMLLSALESHLMTHGQRVPDYLIERIDDAVAMLKEEAMK